MLTRVLRCLVLALVGWLAYPLILALRTLFLLGAPLHDWLWYLAISLLLLVLPLHIAWRWLCPRPVCLGYAALLLWAIIGYQPPGATAYLDGTNAPPVPISFWCGSPLFDAPDSILADLRTANATLYLYPDPANADIGTERLATGLRRLASYDIPVILAPPLSDFLSVPLHQHWIAQMQAAAAFIQRERLTNVHGLIGDAEHPVYTTQLDPAGRHAADVAAATANMRTLITTLQRDYPTLRIGITSLWPLYLDGLDHDPDLAIIMRSPVDPPGHWDFVNLMAYTSYAPPADRPYSLVTAIRSMSHRYPDTEVSYLIGLVGGGFPWEPLLDFDSLVRDAHRSRALQVREIVVFQLDGALKQFGNDFVARFTTAANGPISPDTLVIPFSRRVSLGHYTFAFADALLDLRSSRLWLALAWFLLSPAIVLRPRPHRPSAPPPPAISE